MPLKNPLKKTFKQKRKGLGVKRVIKTLVSEPVLQGKIEYESFISNMKYGSANPKAHKLESVFRKKENNILKKIFILKKKKPKNELEEKKIKEAILKLKNVFIDLESQKKRDWIALNKVRASSRTKRQEKILFDKLYSILSSKEKFLLATVDNPSSNFSLIKLKRDYLALLKNKNLTFKDIKSNQVITLLDSARTK
jgi:hypothetical protein